MNMQPVEYLVHFSNLLLLVSYSVRDILWLRWFAVGANNAGIAAIGLYVDRVAEFRALMATEKGDLPRFYAQVSQLAKLPKLERDQALAAALVTNQTTLAVQPPLTAKP